MIKYIDLVHLYVFLHHPKELTEHHYKTKDFHHPLQQLQRHQLMKYLAVIVELIAVAVVVIVRMEMLRLAVVSAAAAQAHLAQQQQGKE